MRDWIRALPWELHAAARALVAHRGYAVLATFTLALGIGGSVVVVSVVDAVAFAEMPYAEPERLAALYERSLVDPDIDRWPVSRANYLDWQEAITSFDVLEAYEWASPLMSTDSTALRASGVKVTGGLFGLLGVAPALGRTIGPADIEADAAVAVISDGLWARAFGRDANVVGREVTLDRVPTRIVGVMPADFRYPFSRNVEVWRPLVMTPEQMNSRTSPELFVTGRLAPGVDRAAAREELAGIAAVLRAEYPDANGERGVTVVSMREDWLEWRLPVLMIFVIAALLGLAIACINLAGLMLSRGLARLEELSVRQALGATRVRLAAVVLAEGLLIALAGTFAGTIIAAAILPVLLRLAPGNWGGPMLATATVDLRALLAASSIGVVTVLAASLAPILAAWRSDPIAAMGTGSRSAGGRRQAIVRRALVVLQTALAVFLLAQAGLLTRSMIRTYTYDVGFDYENILIARVLSEAENPEDEQAYYRSLAEELGSLPGANAAWLATIPPLTGLGAPVSVTTDGSEPGSLDAGNRVEFRGVDPEYFELLDIPIVRGRLFDDRSVEGAERVGVVNRAFVAAQLGTADPLDSTVRAKLHFRPSQEGFDDPIRIIGVVDDIAEWGLWSQPPMLFVPAEQARTTGLMHVMLKTEVPPESLAEPLRQTAWDLGSRLPLEEVGALATHYRDLYGMHDFMLFIMSVFAVMAIVLAAVGLYGVVSLQVTGRRRELSVRLALGATGQRVVRNVLREGLVLSCGGAALAGMLAAGVAPWVGESWLARFLHGLEWFDPVSFTFAAVMLIAIAAVASLAPARQAARVDPASALRDDT